MSEKFFVIIDIDKIQDYIFRNIKLKPIFGASLLVAELTSREFCTTESVLKDFKKVKQIKELSLGKQFMPVFFGGGNIKVLFGNYDDACNFVEDMQRLFIEKAPGSTFSHVIYKFSDNFDNSVIEQAERELKKIKQSKLSSIQPLFRKDFNKILILSGFPQV